MRKFLSHAPLPPISLHPPDSAGTYGYKFLVHGSEWLFDPANPERKTVDNIPNSAVTVTKESAPGSSGASAASPSLASTPSNEIAFSSGEVVELEVPLSALQQRAAAALSKENRKVIGMLLGGCNEGTASNATKTTPYPYKLVPLFLSSGTVDKIADPEIMHWVERSLKSNGFRKVRFELPGSARCFSRAHDGGAAVVSRSRRRQRRNAHPRLQFRPLF